MTIPKRIFTIWLDERDRVPELVRRCIASQKIDGYEHDVITLDRCRSLAPFKPYLRQGLESSHLKRRFCKLADYLRVLVLLEVGGIYLDADVEVLPGRNFDALLSSGMFVGREQSGLEGPGMVPFACSAVIGAEPGHPLIAEWLRRVETRFRGDDDKPFESSMLVLNDLLWELRMHRGPWALSGADLGRVEELPADAFYPYCHRQGIVGITPGSICYHHFMKSWV